jgi:hypothetical protein
MIDYRTISTKQEYEELLRGLAERLPNVISNESQALVNSERKQAENGAYETIERELEKLAGFPGVVMDMDGETHDQRQQKRHLRAMRARSFLNAYDFYAENRKGSAPESDMDPRLMKIVVMAVQAHEAFDNARPDIMRHIIIPPAQAPTPVKGDIVIESGKKP